MSKFRLRFLPVILYIILLTFTACQPRTQEVSVVVSEIKPVVIPPAYEAIKERGDTLVALAVRTSASYFMWKGHVLGYEYDMLKKFTEHKGWGLRIKLVDNIDSLFCCLNRGEGDLVAYSMTVTNDRRQKVNFSQRLYHSQQVLVQKKPNNWREMKLHQIDNSLIRNVLDLKQKPIYVRMGSSYYSRLLSLGNEIGDTLNVITVDGVKTTFDLIELVAQGRIQYTVADEEIAGMYAAYDSSIDYQTPISMPQKKAWSVRKNSPQLLADINSWLDYFKRYKEFYFIYDKYFNNPNTFRKINRSPYSSRTGKLSQYDEIIKAEALRINWDWRLLASLVYQESHFDQSLVSWMGATGLMQVMPNTADMHGFKNIYHAPTNVKAGVDHLRYIEKNFADLDSLNRIKFTLAAYNVGLGHVYDAQRLATYLGLDPKLWDHNVAEAILLKSEKEYYQLPACRNGYCRGSEPYKYVTEITERYENYKHLID